MNKRIGLTRFIERHSPRALALALALAFSPCFGAVDDPVVQKLIEQARFWQQKNRPDLAADAWRKLLRTDPNHPLALVQLGTLEAQAGNIKEADDLYQRAKALKEVPVGLAELETAFKIQRAVPADLSNARKQAQAGQPEQAIKAFQNILGETKPAGQFGLEYYQTLGGTREGWDEARRGMEQLVRENPGDQTYLLALARHLTYRESTRREGIRQLSRLAQQEATAQEAKKAWRQGLVWLGARAADRSLYQQYLSIFSNDQAVRERLRQLDKPSSLVSQKPDLAALERRAGFRWLNSGDVEKAEASFRALLAKKPGDLDAKGGLASVFMRRSAWVEASQLLDEVVAKGGKNWRAAQQTARYWVLIGEVNEARQAEQPREVELKLQQALAIDPKEPAGLTILADIVAEKRDFVRAEPLYRQVLKRQPDNAGAFLGLVSVLSQTDREQEALALIAAQGGSGELKMRSLNQTKAQALFKLAQKDEQLSLFESAMQRMEDALLLDPVSPFIRLALARLYQRVGDPGGANALIDNLLDSFPDLPDALYARALLYAEQDRPSEALMILEGIAPSKRTTAMAADQRRLWVQVQAQRARQLNKQGQTQAAINLVEQAQSAAGNNFNLLGTVAGAWADIGQPQRALQILREVRVNNVNQDANSRIQYAGLLLNTKQDVELATVLRELAQQTQLTPKQYEDLNSIILAYTLRQTDALREAGRLAEAFDAVSPALAQTNDTRLTMALARIYQSGGDPAQALQLAESVVEREPDDLEHRLFTAGVAMAAKQLDKASVQANAALELAPDHPRVLAQAGRVEKLRGNLIKALEYFQFAQALEREKSAFNNAPGNLSLRLVDANPSLPTVPNPAAPVRNQLLPLPGVNRNAPNTLNVPNTLNAQPARQFSDPLTSNQANSPAISSATSPSINLAALPPIAPETNTSTNRPDASTLNAIYQAAYQAARDSFEGKPERESKRSTSSTSSKSSSKPSNRIKNTKLNKRADLQTQSDVLEEAISSLATASPGAELETMPEWRATANLRNATAERTNAVFELPTRPQAQSNLTTRASFLAPESAPEFAQESALAPSPEPSLASAPVTNPFLAKSKKPTTPRVPPQLLSRTPRGVSPTALAQAAARSPQDNVATDSQSEADKRERTISEEIQAIQLKFTTTLDIAAAYRNRSGEEGTGRLSEIELPVVFKTSLDSDHALTLRLTPVLLEAGDLNLADPVTASRFGTLALGPFVSNPFPNEEQDASGVAIGVAFGNDDFNLDIGTTPLGFKVRNLVGGASYTQTTDLLTMKVGINRRAVTDSVLSYAGSNDPLSGRIFGGVVKTGIRLDGTLGDEQFGVYGSLGAASLNGRAVKTNVQLEGSAGVYLRAYDRLNQRLTVGANLNLFGYRHNLSRFTLGHGGYFSPQQYVSLGFPVDFAGRWGKLSYDIGIDASIRRIVQDRKAFFPNDPDLQTILQTRIATNPQLAQFGFAFDEERESGLGVNFRTSVEYLIAPQVALGGRLSFDNSRNFTQQTGLLYFRYSYNPLLQPVPFPPKGTRALHSGDPL